MHIHPGGMQVNPQLNSQVNSQLVGAGSARRAVESRKKLLAKASILEDGSLVEGTASPEGEGEWMMGAWAGPSDSSRFSGNGDSRATADSPVPDSSVPDSSVLRSKDNLSGGPVLRDFVSGGSLSEVKLSGEWTVVSDQALGGPIRRAYSNSGGVLLSGFGGAEYDLGAGFRDGSIEDSNSSSSLVPAVVSEWA